MEKDNSWLSKQYKHKSNEKKRPGSEKLYSDIFGMEGSFRQLSVDWRYILLQRDWSITKQINFQEIKTIFKLLNQQTQVKFELRPRVSGILLDPLSTEWWWFRSFPKCPTYYIVIFIYMQYCHFGCGISKMVGPKKQHFWPKLNPLEGNHCTVFRECNK